MKSVHFMGIGGSGTSAAAAIAQSQGFKITGCDKDPHTEFTKNFDKASLFTGHSQNHLYCHPELVSRNERSEGSKKLIDILAVTPAIESLDPNNQEIKAAREKGIEVLTWQEFVGKYLQKDKFVIAICGTHGKSTVTAMIAKLLADAQLDPTVILGATVPEWKANYRVPSQTHHNRDYFVIEADEYHDNFLSYTPNITVVTNIEMDHPEYFKSFKDYKDSFYQFLLKTKETIVANIEDVNIAHILKDLMKEIAVTAIDYSKHQLNFPLQVPGEYNRLNAQAVFQVGLILGINPDTARQSLSAFTGIGRRFEYVGQFKGAQVYSDFGHHPTEIKTTMQAAREKFLKQKLWLVYEPHMFSRTKALFDDFVKVFKSLPVDQTIILDIYPSREKDTGMVKSQMLVQSTNKPNVRYNSPEEIKETLSREVQAGDVVFFMGAGDIDKLARKIAS